MNSRGLKGALQQYNQIGVQSDVDGADPHRLIQLLLDGALDKITKARGFMMNQKIAQKGEHISWAISIIEGLRASLDKGAGGEIAHNLENLYIYMERRLVEANLNNDPDILIEVAGLLGEIREAWVVIRDQVRPAPAVIASGSSAAAP